MLSYRPETFLMTPLYCVHRAPCDVIDDVNVLRLSSALWHYLWCQCILLFECPVTFLMTSMHCVHRVPDMIYNASVLCWSSALWHALWRQHSVSKQRPVTCIMTSVCCGELVPCDMFFSAGALWHALWHQYILFSIYFVPTAVRLLNRAWPSI